VGADAASPHRFDAARFVDAHRAGTLPLVFSSPIFRDKHDELELGRAGTSDELESDAAEPSSASRLTAQSSAERSENTVGARDKSVCHRPFRKQRLNTVGGLV
jgi:hypothetical protein